MAHKKSVWLDPQFADFDQFVDQLSAMFIELDIPLLKKEIKSPEEKPIIEERFYIEMQIMKMLLLREQFDSEEAMQYREDFPEFKFPEEKKAGRTYFGYRAGPVFTRYTIELVLYFTLLRFKLSAFIDEDQSEMIMTELSKTVWISSMFSLEKILTTVYQQAERLISKHGKKYLRIAKNNKVLKYETGRPPMGWYRPGRTFECKCGWIGLTPIVAGFGGFCRPVRYFCPACKKEIR